MIVHTLIATVQLFIGMYSNSISIVTDAVNSYSSSGMAIVNIIGVKMAQKPADKKHPHGYGRLEYFINIYLAIFIVIAGVETMNRSYKAIGTTINRTFSLNIAFAVFIFATSLIKLYLGRHAKHVGQENMSHSLQTLGIHSLREVFFEMATAVGLLVTAATGIHIDAYLGIIISLYMWKTAYNLIHETIGTLIGRHIEGELAAAIKNSIVTCDDHIHGAYDLVIHDYGINNKVGTCNVEIEENVSIGEADKALHKIQRYIYEEYGIYLVLGIYAINESDEEATAIKKCIGNILKANPHVENFHGFYYERETGTIRFDIVIDFEIEDEQKLRQEVCQRVNEICPFKVEVNVEHGYALDYNMEV